MHEAGLARGIAKALRERGLSPDRVRLAVRGGHHDAAEFERELRAHLAAQMPEQAAAVARLKIRRIPCGHMCPRCGVEFDSELPAPACPNCASETLTELAQEQVEIELMEAVR